MDREFKAWWVRHNRMMKLKSDQRWKAAGRTVTALNNKLKQVGQMGDTPRLRLMTDINSRSRHCSGAFSKQPTHHQATDSDSDDDDAENLRLQLPATAADNRQQLMEMKKMMQAVQKSQEGMTVMIQSLANTVQAMQVQMEAQDAAVPKAPASAAGLLARFPSMRTMPPLQPEPDLRSMEPGPEPAPLPPMPSRPRVPMAATPALQPEVEDKNHAHTVVL